jgi:polysaccharide export outer membrane protein
MLNLDVRIAGMSKMFRGFSIRSAIAAGLVCVLLIGPLAVQAQIDDPAINGDTKPGSAGSKDPISDYTIGADDILTVTVADAPEFGGKFRVSDSGFIEIQGISEPISAAGKSTSQLAVEIRKALIGAKQLRDPRVTVFIEEFRSRVVTVLGSVTKPGVYPLEKHTTVLDALSLAGGALPNAGNVLTIVRGPASAEASGTAPGSVQIIDVSRILSGESAFSNVEVRTGDVINVSVAQVVYVVGAVVKPGGYPMNDPTAGVSIVQAVTLAQGFTPQASTHRGLIIRQSTSGSARQEIPVDISQMMDGKQTDLVLAPNDILVIPESNFKKSLKVLGDVAMAAVNGIAIYGIGYKVGNIP